MVSAISCGRSPASLPSSGSVQINGAEAQRLEPRRSRVGAGLVYVPRERHREALMLQLGVGKNIGLIALARNAIFGVIDRRRELSEINKQVAALSIKTPRLDAADSESVGRQSAKGGDRKVPDGSSGRPAGGRAVSRRRRRRSLRDLQHPAQRRRQRSRRDYCVGGRDGARRPVRPRPDLFARLSCCGTFGSAGRRAQDHRGGADRNNAADPQERRATNDHSHELPPGGLCAERRTARRDSGAGRLASIISPYYLTGRNFSNMLTLLTAATFISLGQLVVLLAGGIDLSVGPLTGLVVVVASFFVNDGSSVGSIARRICAVASRRRRSRRHQLVSHPPGPHHAGYRDIDHLYGTAGRIACCCARFLMACFNSDVTAAISSQIGFVPTAFIVCVLLVALLEYGLRRSRWGLTLRAVGSNEANARRVGVNVGLTVFRRLRSLFAAYLSWRRDADGADRRRRSDCWRQLHAREHHGGGSGRREPIRRAAARLSAPCWARP